MTVIGVTDEGAPLSKIESYVQDNSIQYLIADGGGGGYKTGSIPHAWLVSARGEIVWDGHPGRLQNSLIEENLKRVRLTPSFELPKDLRSAARYLNRGDFARGVKALEKYLQKPKSDEAAEAARKALETVNSYGKDKLKEVDAFAKEGYYADAMATLVLLEKSFKGMEVGDTAKAKRAEWRKDATIKAELAASVLIDKAQQLVRKKDYRSAYKVLSRVLKTKRYSETKARERAEKLQDSVRKRV